SDGDRRMDALLDALPQLRGELWLSAAPDELRLGAQPRQFACALGALLRMGQDVGPLVLSERKRLQLLDGGVPRHDAPSRYADRRSRNCRRARWISFFTFCR